MAEMGVISGLSVREPDGWTMAALCSLAALEGADNQLLGASLFYQWSGQQGGLGLSVDHLATMAAAQGICTNMVAPFWGVVADRGITKQKYLMVIAAMGQGIVTIILAMQEKFGPGMVLCRCLNGMFLAGLRPIANGVVAKRTSTHLQGKIFSRVWLFVQLGSAICTFIVGNLAGWKLGYIGNMLILGWRPAWVIVGFLSVAASFFTVSAMQEGEPVRVKPEQGLCSAVKEELALFASYLAIPSFIIMVLQGIAGTIPWTVLWMMQSFYLSGGMSSFAAATLVAVNPVFGMMGTLLGGIVSDKLAVMFGPHGRPLTAQLTVALGVPWMIMNFVGLPIGSSVWWYTFANFGFGIFGNAAQAGCNWPVLSQIVPEDSRSRVMAVEGAAENSLAAYLGPKFLAVISNYLGYQPTGGVDARGASLLGLSLCLTTVLPWLGAFLVYSLLHATFPLDLHALQARSEQADMPTKKRSSSIPHLGSRGFSSSHI